MCNNITQFFKKLSLSQLPRASSENELLSSQDSALSFAATEVEVVNQNSPIVSSFLHYCTIEIPHLNLFWKIEPPNFETKVRHWSAGRTEVPSSPASYSSNPPDHDFRRISILICKINWLKLLFKDPKIVLNI